MGGQRHASAALPPGKTQYPLYTRLGGPQSWSGRMRKISPLPGFDPRTVQPLASHYTNLLTSTTRNFLFPHNAQAATRIPKSRRVGSRVAFRGGKVARACGCPITSFSDKVKIAGSCNSTPQFVFQCVEFIEAQSNIQWGMLKRT